MTRFVAAVLLSLVSAGALADAPAEMIVPGATRVTSDGPTTEYDTTLAPADVVAFYRKILPPDGWSMTDNVTSPAVISFFFSRGANAEGSVFITIRGDHTHVALKLTE